MTPRRSKDEPRSKESKSKVATRWLLPPAASIALHAGLLIGLTAVTIEVTREREPPRSKQVTLSAAPVPPPNTDTSVTTTTDQVPGISTTPSAPTEPAALTNAVTSASNPPPAVSAPTQLAPTPLSESILNPDNAGTPRVRFAEIDAAPARTVVFVVDASGAVATAFTFVREELLRSIDQLSPTQRFQVVVFPGPENSAPRLAPINDGRLAHASPQSKRTVAEWMSTFRPRGRSAPLAGLRQALLLRPDVALLITRSIERTGPDAAWGSGLKEILEELNTLNPVDPRTTQRRTAIAAVQLLDEDPTGIMPAIAAIHGSGLTDYRVVTAETLASPRDPRPRATGAKNTDTIDAASSILADLEDSGTALRIFHGLADGTDIANARDQAIRAAELASRTPNDPRARVLLARARSITLEPAMLRAAIEVLEQEMLHDPDADAWRRLALVDALAASDELDQASAEIASLRQDATQMTISRPIYMRLSATAIAIGDGTADIESAIQQPPFVDDAGVVDPYWLLAMTEASTKARLQSNQSDVYTPLLALLERAEREGADGWAPILLDRVARVASMSPTSLETAPARVRLEVAILWSRTPANRAQARVILRSLLAQPSPQRAEALWLLAVLDRSVDTPTSRASAAGLLSTLALDYPDHARAPDALAGAIALTDNQTDQRKLLEQAIRSFPNRPEIDIWRLRLAGHLQGKAKLDMLEQVTPGTRESTLAREQYISTAESLLNEPTEPAEHQRITERTAAFLAEHDDPNASEWLAQAAQDLLNSDPSRALDLALHANKLADRHARGITQTQLILAQAHIANHQPADATNLLVSVATSLDAATDRSALFWQAWTLLLETAGPDDPATASAHLARLKLLDTDLGGEPWRTRLIDLSDQLRTP